MLVNLI